MCLWITFLGMNKHLKLHQFVFYERNIWLHTKNGSRTKNIGVLLPTKSQRPIEI
jgi:hypothetical protein